jgi:hypothetical protein
MDLIADALLGAEEILEVLHRRGTRGVEQECNAGRIADVLRTIQVAKRVINGAQFFGPNSPHAS